MKKFCIIFTMIAFITTLIHAQNTTNFQFYGMKLGCSKYAIEKGVISQGKTGEWKYDKQRKQKYYEVINPQLGPIKFSYAKFYIESDILSEAIFIEKTNVEDANLDNVVPGYRAELKKNKANAQNSTVEKYQIMLNALLNKYGVPTTNTENKCSWRLNNQILSIDYSSFSNIEDMGFLGKHTVYYYLFTISYKKSDLSLKENF